MTMNAHKRGDTFDYSDQFAMTDNGVPVPDFTGMTGASQIRTAEGVLVAALTFSWLDATQGLFRVRFEGSTAAWPLGTLLHDIQLTTGAGAVVSTATETFRLVQDVTYG